MHAGVEFKDKWHVGDTPMDIQAAQGGHAKALGVLTGVYSRQDLEGCGASEFAFCLGQHKMKVACCWLHQSQGESLACKLLCSLRCQVSPPKLVQATILVTNSVIKMACRIYHVGESAGCACSPESYEPIADHSPTNVGASKAKP